MKKSLLFILFFIGILATISSQELNTKWVKINKTIEYADTLDAESLVEMSGEGNWEKFQKDRGQRFEIQVNIYRDGTIEIVRVKPHALITKLKVLIYLSCFIFGIVFQLFIILFRRKGILNKKELRVPKPLSSKTSDES